MTDLEKILNNFVIILTFPVIIFSIIVIIIWLKDTIKSLQKTSKNRDPSDWLIIGITLGFICIAMDSIMWLIFSSFDMMIYGNSFTLLLFTKTIKQIFGVASAYCHIRSFLEAKKKRMNYTFLLLSILIGGLYVLLLNQI